MNQRPVWWPMLGVLVIVVGVVLLLAVLGVIGSPGRAVGIVFGCLFIIVGVCVLVRGRPGTKGAWDAWVGSVRRSGPGWSVGDERYQVGIGEMRLDLTHADIPEGEHRLDLGCFIGSIGLVVPRNVGVDARGYASAGSVTILGQKADGLGRSLSARSSDYAASTKKLVVNAEVVLGEVKIEYGTSEEQ